MNDFLKKLDFDFAEILERISGFFEMLRNEVWNDDMTGLTMYLWSCIPEPLRDFFFIVLILALILGIRELFNKQ